MREIVKKLIPLFLCAALLCAAAPPCYAQENEDAPVFDFEGKTLSEIITEYMENNRLNEDNFSMGFYDTRSGETFYYNENKYMIGGSMYKLPLCMSYIRFFDEGKYTPQDTIGGVTIGTLIDRAITFSDNDAADMLRRHLGLDHISYRNLLLQFSDVSPEDADHSFYTVNGLSPHLMLQTLQTLYENSEFYERIITDMKNAHPGLYFRKYQGDYEIAHKYGYMDGAVNDCAIVYTPHPFFLVVFTKDVYNSEKILGELCQMMTQYSLYLDEVEEQERLAAEEAQRIAAEERAAAEKAEALRLAAQEKARAEQARIAAEEAQAQRIAAAEASAALAARVQRNTVIGVSAAVLAAALFIFLRKKKAKAK